MGKVFSFVFQLFVLLMSVSIHEFAHGWAAWQLGDPTAKNQGRLSLNPLKHLDLVGSFLVPLFLYVFSAGAVGFGWAKPVPYNPYHLRDAKYGESKVAIAGPLANLSVALIFGLILRFNLAFVFFSYDLAMGMSRALAFVVILNIVLAVFNLVPLPPLDGSKILFAFWPDSNGLREFLEQYGMFLVILFILFGFNWIYPVADWIYGMIVGV